MRKSTWFLFYRQAQTKNENENKPTNQKQLYLCSWIICCSSGPKLCLMLIFGEKYPTTVPGVYKFSVNFQWWMGRMTNIPQARDSAHIYLFNLCLSKKMTSSLYRWTNLREVSFAKVIQLLVLEVEREKKKKGRKKERRGVKEEGERRDKRKGESDL